MSDLIVKIGNDALDLSDDQTIAITKQAAKVGDFSAILADGTNEVTVPLTPNNRTILDNAHLVTSDSSKPYGRLDATLIQEGYETIQDGYAIIKSSANNFSLQVVGGNASFFNRIKDLDLRELDLSDYDHFWTNNQAFVRRNTTEGLIYAVFEQSADAYTMRTYSSTPNDRFAVHTDQLLPSFYVKTLVEKIFSQQGYTFVTDIETDDIYDKAVVFRAEAPDRGTVMSHHECTVTNTVDYPVVAAPLAGESFPFVSVTGDSEYVNSTDFKDSIESDGKVRLTDSCRLTVSFEILVDSPYSAPNSSVFLDVFYTTANGVVNFQTDEQVVPFGTSTYTTSFTIDVTEYEGEIYFYTKVLSTIIPNLEVLTGSSYTISDVSLIDNAKVTTSFPFNYITGALPVPDIKQGEFLKELAKMYQWIFDVDERTRTVTARRFDEIGDNIPNAIDLSDKIHANDIKINFGIDGFAQTNALRFQEDDETKYDAVGYINVDDTTLQAEKDYVKMEHLAATSTRQRFETVNAPYVPIFEEGEPSNGLRDRIFLVRRENPFPENVNFYRLGSTPENLPTDDLTFAYFAEAGNNDSLDFPTLIDRFYQKVIDMNDRGKTIEALVNLNIKDVDGYDPFKPVYISHLGNYFFWQKLGNYVKGKLTKCTFVKI